MRCSRLDRQHHLDGVQPAVTVHWCGATRLRASSWPDSSVGSPAPPPKCRWTTRFRRGTHQAVEDRLGAFMAPMRSVKTDQGRFTADVAGPSDGELVLLLHGFPPSRHTWRHHVPALALAERNGAEWLRSRAEPSPAAEFRVQEILAVPDLSGRSGRIGAEESQGGLGERFWRHGRSRPAPGPFQAGRPYR